MYSYKLEKPGLRTASVVDINGFGILHSESLSCKDNTDAPMMKKLRPDRIMKNTDCLMLDGGYSSVGSTLILLHNNELLESDSDDKVLSENNFIIPIRKIKYVEFHPSEERYNDEFGGLRSMIETRFAELGNTFFFFHANNPIKMIKHKIYNAKYNLTWLLLNIKKFVDKYNIPVLEHHEAWIEKDFDFSKD